jgi:aminoglycoside N3'-acetyltransferase
MMAGNFQQMGNAGGNQVMMHQSQAQFHAQQQAIQNVLLQNIQQQTGTLTGWQANIPITERLGQVWHM